MKTPIQRCRVSLKIEVFVDIKFLFILLDLHFTLQNITDVFVELNKL